MLCGGSFCDLYMSARGYGQGRGGGRRNVGGPRECVCPSCGARVAHARGVPCLETKCPKCGAKMLPSN